MKKRFHEGYDSRFSPYQQCSLKMNVQKSGPENSERYAFYPSEPNAEYPSFDCQANCGNTTSSSYLHSDSLGKAILRYDSPTSPYHDNGSFFIPNLPVDRDDHLFVSNTSPYPSRNYNTISTNNSLRDCESLPYSTYYPCNFAGEVYGCPEFDNYPVSYSGRRGTYDMSYHTSGNTDRSRFYSELLPPSQLGDNLYQNVRECYYPSTNPSYPYSYTRPRRNAESHLHIEDEYEDPSFAYNSYFIQSDSVDPYSTRSFSPLNPPRSLIPSSSTQYSSSSVGDTSVSSSMKDTQYVSKSSKRKPAKKVVNSSTAFNASTEILNPDDIDPAVNPRVFSGRKPKKNMDYSKFRINLEEVKSGKDSRLTLMIKNIPNSYTQEHMLEILDTFVKDEYDFFYMPVDFKTNCNLGFGYVSMISTSSVIKVYEKLNNTKWNNTSTKICEVNYARMQGKEDMQKFCKDWTIMNLPEKYRPVFFDKETCIVDGKEVITMKRVVSK